MSKQKNEQIAVLFHEVIILKDRNKLFRVSCYLICAYLTCFTTHELTPILVLNYMFLKTELLVNKQYINQKLPRYLTNIRDSHFFGDIDRVDGKVFPLIFHCYTSSLISYFCLPRIQNSTKINYGCKVTFEAHCGRCKSFRQIKCVKLTLCIRLK